MAKNSPFAKDAGINGKDRKGSNSLVICRNKHWRYISCYHGPWFQLPPELLESLAHENFIMPQPRLIDPAVFFDIVKIRRAIDEATEEAVRANSGVSNVGNSSRYDPFGGGQQPASQMSKERIHRVRQKAVKLLAKAYALDEVAASVVTMSSSSSLEDVAEHVLRRDKEDIDAKYVHFFHEKIPSRMEEHTPLTPLDEIMAKMAWEAQGAPFRTRGLVRIMKSDLEHAADDFTYSLRIAQELKKRHKPGNDQLVLAKDFKKAQEQWERNPKSIPQLKDDEQPTSMEQQLFFNRGNVYLALACDSVHESLNGLDGYMRKITPDPKTGNTEDLTPKEVQQHSIRLEARKRVKTYAKRAWKDYMSFLGFFDYTPGFPNEVTQEIMQRVYDIADGAKSNVNGHHDDDTHSALSSIRRDALAVKQSSKPSPFDLSSIPPPKVYSSDALFASQPLPDLPPFPSSEPPNNNPASSIPGVREALTYHPLLPDALHSLLLTHCLLQTSPTELQRHAHSAARLSRIADGYPIFQPPRSPARADWIEILRKCNNWIKLPMGWAEMCRPVSAAASTKPNTNGTVARNGQSASKPTETDKERKNRIRQQAIADAMGDERVVDEETFHQSVSAREKRAEEDEERDKRLFTPVTPGDKLLQNGAAAVGKAEARERLKDEKLKRWAEDEALKEYPVTTERVEAISRWVREAPGVMPGAPTRKKKKAAGKRKKKEGVLEGMEGLSVQDGVGEVEEGPD
ncbi:hypothetical protein BDZ85DRAFT_122567 [Elsinoe ampelina]|uniref:Histidine kinase group protein n=1 Tax=Elsinoe ampelina TaxID=302913 RepID=A0A6A6GC16_9PEZI|nr:hypothetical protein BDZ85DRAFT_122567 [Elsinoe ampelina]